MRTKPYVIEDLADDKGTVSDARKVGPSLAKGPITTAVTGSTPTIALCEDNHIYECGELTSLTITAFDNPGRLLLP